MRSKRSWLVYAVLLVSLAACSGGKKDDDKGGGNVACTPANTVAIATGHGSNNGTCTQLDTSFQLNSTVCACANWACLTNGDKVEYTWDGPPATDHIDTWTRDDGQTSGIALSYCHKLAATGSWSMRLRRNGQGAGTWSFTVY